MKTIIITQPGKVEIIQQERPQLTQGNAILKLLYGGICGSDLGTYKGTFLYSSYPRVPGHEFSAEIVEIGENSAGLVAGMVVTCNPYFNCGNCYSCRRGFVNCCTGNQTMGAQRDGAFSEYISMPIERIYSGQGIDAQTLALVEPFCISYHAAKRANIKPCDRVLVVGGGAIGQLAALAAKKMGAEVYLSDVVQKKCDHAMGMGIDGTILNTDSESFKGRAAEITNGDGFDVCIEAVGLPSTFMNCIDAAAFRARVVIVGIGKQSLDFFYSIIQTKELDVHGSRNAVAADFNETIAMVKSGELSLKHVISSQYALDDAGTAFENLSKQPDTLKVMIEF